MIRITKALREYRSILKHNGCKVLKVTQTSHYKFFIEAPSGQQGIVVGSVTPSDHRTMSNFESNVRKWMSNLSKSGQPTGTGKTHP